MTVRTESMHNRRHLSRTAGDKLFSIILIAPAFLVALSFILVPVVDSILKSFQKYEVKNIISGRPGVWNNFGNYIRLFNNDKLLPSVTTTFSFVLFVVVAGFLLSMALALILNSNIRGAKFLQGLMMTPWIIPTVISALIWTWLYQPQYGLVRFMVALATRGSVSDLAMLNNPSTALFGVGIAALWKQIPLMTLLLLAGLQGVPDEMIEAATIDGAGAPTRLFRIVIPYMMTVIKIVISMSIIENFKQFPLFWIMTGGGPDGATTTLAILSYREAFVGMNLGSGAAVTTVWMLLMILVVFLYNRAFKAVDME